MAIELEEPMMRPAQGEDPVDRRLNYVLATAELADCNCPGPCERDHGND
jgi:hypothetical protein